VHPAPSIILFSTWSGASYGLLFLLGLAAPLGLIPSGRWLGFVAMALALGLVTFGLLASTFHFEACGPRIGRPGGIRSRGRRVVRLATRANVRA
jgi:hypothetical protein